MESYLPYFWFYLMAGILILFSVLAGADLGVGIISLLEQEDRKTETLKAITPQWYAHETWLVIAAATLFGAFPHVFGLILSSLYVPAMMLIFGLMMRAVSAEFRHNQIGARFWNIIFGVGCLIAALGLGLLLAGVLTNPDAVSLPGTGAWNWLNPVAILVAIGLAAVFFTMGAARVISRKEISITPGIWRCYRYGALVSAAVFVILMGLVLGTSSAYHQAWSEGYRIILAPLFAAMTVLCLAAAFLTSTKQVRGRGQYAWSTAGFISAAGIILAIVYPFVIPFSHTIIEAASPHSTQVIMLYGVGIVIPVIIFYNIYIGRVFSRQERKNPEDE